MVASAKYRPEIDGLRAIAIGSVLLYHLGVAPLSGGFVGVDVFFVISGYLITSILVEEMCRNDFSFLAFYERRARRLFPALFIVCSVSAAATIFFIPPYYQSQFGQSLSATALFSANFLFWWEDGYFDFASELKPLLHMWSLGIEEQFYLITPLILFLCWRYWTGLKAAIFVLSALTVTSLCISIVETSLEFSSAFFLLPSRFWELGLGALIAIGGAPFFKMDVPLNIRNAIEIAAFLVLLYTIFFYDSATPFPGASAIAPTLATGLIIASSSEATVIGKALSLKPIVGLGLISYSLYLWHYPIIAIAKFLPFPAADNPLLLAGASIILAYVSYKFVERPFRNKGWLSRKVILGSTCFGSLAIFLFGYLIYVGSFSFIFESRDSIKNNEIYQLHKSNTLNYQIGSDCQLSTTVFDAFFERELETCIQKKGKFILVMGDSHAINLTNVLFHEDSDAFIVGVGKGGCRFSKDAFEACEHYQKVISFLKKNEKHISTIIFHVSGSEDYVIDWRGNVGTTAIFDSDKPFSIATKNIERTVSFLEQIPLDTQIIWVGPFQEPQVDPFLVAVRGKPLSFNPQSILVFDTLEVAIKKVFEQREREVGYFSLKDDLDAYGLLLKIDSCITFRDKDHFSACGEEFFASKTGLGRFLRQER